MTWIDITDDVYTALKNDPGLNSALGGAYVYPQGLPDGTHYPYVTYFEINNYDDGYADNDPTASRIRIQVDVWTKTNPTPPAVEIDRIMKSLGFTRSYAGDLFEKDTKTVHRAMRYKIEKSY